MKYLCIKIQNVRRNGQKIRYITMKKVEHLLARKLLDITAIKLQPDNPFTWGSGWVSPIYTDSRKILSYPEVRTFVKTEISRVILENFPGVECLAGVATGAIAHGALAADQLGLPYCFVRLTPKDHGLENLIEGTVKLGQKIVVIEDNLSTAHSSLKVMETLEQAGCEVLGEVAIFDFGFAAAEAALRAKGVKVFSLTNFDAMVDAALGINFITQEDAEALRSWHNDPEMWS